LVADRRPRRDRAREAVFDQVLIQSGILRQPGRNPVARGCHAFAYRDARALPPHMGDRAEQTAGAATSRDARERRGGGAGG
jgi:hypothetical protein